MAAGLDTSFRNCASLLYTCYSVLLQYKSICSAVFLPFLYKHFLDLTLKTLIKLETAKGRSFQS
jgi:hypothetical protein